jgi:hypothetical protein
MYIIVEAKSSIIVGTALRKVSVAACSKNGQKVYEIPDSEFSPDMIGSVLKINSDTKQEF